MEVVGEVMEILERGLQVEDSLDQCLDRRNKIRKHNLLHR